MRRVLIATSAVIVLALAMLLFVMYVFSEPTTPYDDQPTITIEYGGTKLP